MINVMVFDLDRTLLRDDSTISDVTIRTLQKAKEMGKIIVIATARTIEMSMPLFSEEFHNSYWICSNGGKIYNGKELVYSSMFSRNACDEIIELFATQFPTYPLAFISGHKIITDRNMDLFFNKHFPQLSYEIGLEKINQLPSIDKVLFELNPAENPALIESALPANYSITISMGVMGEIIPIDTSKYKGLLTVLNLLNLSFDSVIAFGDDSSDIEMIKYSKIGVAMGNAIPEVKESADIVTSSNNEDGVAKVLDSLMSNINFNF